jgi:hypothetical protein
MERKLKETRKEEGEVGWGGDYERQKSVVQRSTALFVVSVCYL